MAEELNVAKVNGNELRAIADEKATYLGNLLWYTVGGMEIPIERMKELFKKHGVPEKYLPKEPRTVDAFKSASKEQENEKYIVVDGEVEIEVPVEPKPRGKQGKDVKVKTKTVLRKDAKYRLFVNKEATKDTESLPVVGTWKFDHDTGKITATSIDTNGREADFKAATENLLRRYEILKTHYTDKDIRDMLRTIVHSMNSISLRPSGAVYFAPIEHEKLLISVSNLIEEIANEFSKTGTKSEMTTVPVVDTKKQRDLIYVKFETEAIAEIEKMLVETTSLLKKQGAEIVPSKFREYCEALDYIKQNKAKYEALLQQTLDKTQAQLDILQQQLMQVSERVRS